MSWDKMEFAAASLRHKLTEEPQVGLVLGSGLGGFAETLENPVYVDYKSIRDFPVSTVEGHKGRFVIGKKHGIQIIAMQGRVHRYEGFSARDVVFPIRTMWMAGVRTLFLTNAAGGIRDAFEPGDLMLITDHINMTGDNPLIGPNDDRFGPRFPPMGDAYAPKLRDLALHVAREQDVELHQGVYAGMNGPSYETPAEIQMLRAVGADAVGMSTVFETIAARQLGMRVLGISCITNKAAGLPGAVLDHDEVQAVAARARDRFQTLLDGVLKDLHTI